MKGNVYFYHGRGKMGNTVLYTLYGQQCGRAYVGKGEVANPRTPAQLLQRAKIRLLTDLSVLFKSAARIGFFDEARSRGCSAVNYFVHHNYPKVTGTVPDNVVLQPNNIVVSKGNLPPVVFSNTIKNDTPGEVSVVVDHAQLGVEGASADDSVYVVMYCPDLGLTIMGAPAARQDGTTITLLYPTSWSGLEIYVYGFAASVEKVSSDSVMIGHIELA